MLTLDHLLIGLIIRSNLRLRRWRVGEKLFWAGGFGGYDMLVVSCLKGFAYVYISIMQSAPYMYQICSQEYPPRLPHCLPLLHVTE
jgi:hypothetical protein